VFRIWLFTHLASSAFLGQDLPTRSCDVKELFNPRGWSVPYPTSTVVKTKGARLDAANVPEGVFVDVEEPKNHLFTATLFSCAADVPGRLELREQTLKATEILRLSFRGHVFAVQIKGGLVALKGQVEIPLGTEETLMFYDVDGSGQFKVERHGGIFAGVAIPAWASGSPK